MNIISLQFTTPSNWLLIIQNEKQCCALAINTNSLSHICGLQIGTNSWHLTTTNLQNLDKLRGGRSLLLLLTRQNKSVLYSTLLASAIVCVTRVVAWVYYDDDHNCNATAVSAGTRRGSAKTFGALRFGKH